MPRRAVLLLLTVALGGCLSTNPSPTASASSPIPTPPPTPTAPPTPTPVPELEVPLAVVTGYIAVKASITREEVAAAADTILVPCGVTTYLDVTVPADADCLEVDEIAQRLNAAPADDPLFALLPPSQVTPDLKVLPVDGADLFGGPAAR